MRLLLLNIQGHGPISGVLGEFFFFFFSLERILPINHEKLFWNISENTRANVTLLAKKVLNNETGIEYVKLGSLKIKGSVGGGRFHLENLFNGDRVLGDIGNTIINDNAQIFIDEMLPGFEKELAKKFTEIANDILTDVTYDEMFPDIWIDCHHYDSERLDSFTLKHSTAFNFISSFDKALVL